jgi:BirA family transcriptional regulator, biotin operon repressor / biotin---[acetyl-CoA-carboxylase] ligase
MPEPSKESQRKSPGKRRLQASRARGRKPATASDFTALPGLPIPPREQWLLATRRLGQRVLLFDRLDSTNTLAAALAHDSANDGLVILADEQTAGRGQHGRSWQCQPGLGVLLSVLVFPPNALRRPVLLAAWAAVSVCRTIRRTTGLEPQIKWPNDVLVSGRKVCGILIEQARGTVVGVGLNVNQTQDALRAANLPDAASLAILTGRFLDCSEMARLLIRELDREYDRLCSGELSRLEASWKNWTGLLGKTVVVEGTQGFYRGRLRRLSWDLVEVQVPDGELLHLKPETIKHLTAEPASSLQ